jgi:16S rRNA processing protein RimM
MLHCAKIVNTHGVMGEMKAICLADSPAFFKKIKTVYVDNKPYSLKGVKEHKGNLLIRFEEIDNMTKAEALKGKDVFVKREEAPKLPKGRYYIVDLIGLKVLKDDGSEIGEITDVFATGSNDVYEVTGKKKYYIPVIDDVVKEIDIEGGKVIITPLKGLLDDED